MQFWGSILYKFRPPRSPSSNLWVRTIARTAYCSDVAEIMHPYKNSPFVPCEGRMRFELMYSSWMHPMCWRIYHLPSMTGTTSKVRYLATDKSLSTLSSEQSDDIACTISCGDASWPSRTKRSRYGNRLESSLRAII
jgi:hypothetical protein